MAVCEPGQRGPRGRPGDLLTSSHWPAARQSPPRSCSAAYETSPGGQPGRGEEGSEEGGISGTQALIPKFKLSFPLGYEVGGGLLYPLRALFPPHLSPGPSELETLTTLSALKMGELTLQERILVRSLDTSGSSSQLTGMWLWGWGVRRGGTHFLVGKAEVPGGHQPSGPTPPCSVPVGAHPRGWGWGRDSGPRQRLHSEMVTAVLCITVKIQK